GWRLVGGQSCRRRGNGAIGERLGATMSPVTRICRNSCAGDATGDGRWLARWPASGASHLTGRSFWSGGSQSRGQPVSSKRALDRLELYRNDVTSDAALSSPFELRRALLRERLRSLAMISSHARARQVLGFEREDVLETPFFGGVEIALHVAI